MPSLIAAGIEVSALLGLSDFVEQSMRIL